MNCREALPLLPLFVDGELEARQMRGLALHATRCTACEDELRRIERLQDAVAEFVNKQVDEVDLGRVWEGVAPRLGTPPMPLRMRLREWWQADERSWWLQLPVYAGAAAAVLLAIALWQSTSDVPGAPVEVAAVDNSVILDSVKSDAAGLALLREPETNTLVLWVSDVSLEDGDMGGVP